MIDLTIYLLQKKTYYNKKENSNSSHYLFFCQKNISLFFFCLVLDPHTISAEKYGSRFELDHTLQSS